ncbi:MAG: peptidoglycan DD-metalloendopeptidase family protein [Bacteroidetes bacterium]|nr:peptidoglycan DD-metalloendopeptidase family protein [Bacteroidota bacterium]MBS1931058.1 peptidoglycan DD-metalloendopeptidase family protein [Bacteroidota bacterium]
MILRYLFCLIALSGFWGSVSVFAQEDKAELEKERLQLQKDIQDIQNQYNQVKGKTKQSVAQLNFINRKINLQERYINNINKELRMIDDDIYKSNLEIFRLQKQLDTLKAEYARSVVYSYKNRSSYDYINFLFSAGSFNDALKRIGYLKSYRTYREKQVNTILETQQLITKRKEQQQGRKVEKSSALGNQTKQMEVLAEQKDEKASVVSKLRSQENDLEKQLAGKRKRDNELKNSIAAIVRREVELAKKKASEEAKANAAVKPNVSNTTSTTENPTNNPATSLSNAPTIKTTTSGSYLDLNENDVKLNSEFVLNRGRLPWPVDNGYVCIHFGPYTIEGTTLKGYNHGITICAPQAGVPVKTIFNGEVVGVFSSGGEMNVTVRHGKYFTTYSNLSSVSVQKGASVKTGQTLGRLGVDDEGGGGGKLDFLLMIETKEVNPEQWLIRH